MLSRAVYWRGREGEGEGEGERKRRGEREVEREEGEKSNQVITKFAYLIVGDFEGFKFRG